MLAEKCNNIYYFNLTRIPKLTEKSLISIAESNLKDLKYFNLYACSEISDLGFRAFGQANYSKMEFLDLCGCKYLLDDSVIVMSQNFPNLKYFNLTWCVNLKDKAIVDGVAKHLKKLDLLSVYGLVSITDASVEALAASDLKYSLITLDINGCKKMTICTDHASIVKLFPNVEVTIFHS